MNPDRRKGDSLDQIAVSLPEVHSELVRLRSEVRIAKAAWRFTIIVITIAIFTAGVLFYKINEQSLQRAEDRKAFDLKQCENSNVSRAALREDLILGIQNVFIALNPEEAAAPENADDLARFKELFADIASKFPERDCHEYVNGAAAP